MWILRLSLLGEPCLTTPDGQRLTVPGPKGLALLACVASAPQMRMFRSTLADILWSEAPSTSAARHALRQCLVRLRAQLGEAERILITDDDIIGLNPALVSVDLIDVQAALQSGAPETLTAASRMVRGRFCAGLGIEHADFEDWLRDRQGEYDRLCAELHGKAAMILAKGGDGHGAIAAARRRLELEPFQDDAHAALIALCVGFGRRQEAFAAHAACHELFQKELGVPPAQQVDDALRWPMSVRYVRAAPPLSINAAPGPRRSAIGAFTTGLAAAAILFQLAGPILQGRTPEPQRNEMSIWVGPASAHPAQGAAFNYSTASYLNSPGGLSNEQSETANRQIPESETTLAMLYPAGC